MYGRLEGMKNKGKEFFLFLTTRTGYARAALPRQPILPRYGIPPCAHVKKDQLSCSSVMGPCEWEHGARMPAQVWWAVRVRDRPRWEESSSSATLQRHKLLVKGSCCFHFQSCIWNQEEASRGYDPIIRDKPLVRAHVLEAGSNNLVWRPVRGSVWERGLEEDSPVQILLDFCHHYPKPLFQKVILEDKLWQTFSVASLDSYAATRCQFYKDEDDFQGAETFCRPVSSLAFKEHGNAQYQLSRHLDITEEGLHSVLRSLDPWAQRSPVSQAQD